MKVYRDHTGGYTAAQQKGGRVAVGHGRTHGEAIASCVSMARLYAKYSHF